MLDEIVVLGVVL